MPHLENCPHKAGSWCLACVKELWEESQVYKTERDLMRQRAEQTDRRCDDWLETLSAIYNKLGIREGEVPGIELVSDCIARHVADVIARIKAAERQRDAMLAECEKVIERHEKDKNSGLATSYQKLRRHAESGVAIRIRAAAKAAEKGGA